MAGSYKVAAGWVWRSCVMRLPSATPRSRLAIFGEIRSVTRPAHQSTLQRTRQEGGRHTGTATDGNGETEHLLAPNRSLLHGPMRMRYGKRNGKALFVSVSSMGPPSSTSTATSGREDWRHLLLLRREIKEPSIGPVSVEAGHEERPSSSPLCNGD